MSLVLVGFGTEMRLNLTLDQDFIARKHTIEFHGPDGKVEKYTGTPDEFSTGTVYNEEGSHVALHHNDNGVVCYLHNILFHFSCFYFIIINLTLNI